ncbi:unnamed protein product [Schistosoma curassoni]|uniref:coproporphyrinogen oxidase n=1 Tax=Schistosoma curassoni TaxID=6186 RepID=A0A3P8DGA7_9TREM|nr:unnamed protein product [Schistosoma curassoni]
MCLCTRVHFIVHNTLFVLSASAFLVGGRWALADTSIVGLSNKCFSVSCASVPFVTKFPEINLNNWMCLPVSAVDELQGRLCKEVEKIDGKAKFKVDKWERRAGGGGISCVLENGDVFEKAGVNISVISGDLSAQAVKEMRARHNEIDPNKECKFFACGISSVIHPLNPYVPTTHFNFRYFEVDLGNNRKCWWYGGGADLTPYYLFNEDAKHFHEQLKLACDQHNESFYPRFKKWCDDYFYLTHRGETRGVGGIFFDDLDGTSQEKVFSFVKSCAEAIIPAYLPIVEKRKHLKYTNKEREWQLVRRGRYVEFNLIYDRGTKFGLATPEARIESILMSLPRYAQWNYCYDNSQDPRNQSLIEVLKNPKEWV